jgi:alkylation response protein AidB-like acyl-CoA dehydrogenase
MATSVGTDPDALTSSPSTRLASLTERARELRRELPASATEADAENTDADHGMRRLWEEGFFAFHLPARHGGIADADPGQHTEAFFGLLTDIAAGDSSVGMNFLVQSLVTLEVFAAGNGLPEETKAELARLVTQDGIRFVASNAETGNRTGPVSARHVEGGIVVTGTKTFNTNSGAGGWANVGLTLEGEQARWHALIPLDDDGVTCAHDWDVMGQRGTHSQTVRYDDVFVPDGWHYASRGFSPTMVTFVFLLHSSIMLGPGFGALDAVLDYVRNLDRPSLPEFTSATGDPLIRRRIGEFAAELEAARAYLLRAAQRLQNGEQSFSGDAEATIEAFSVKVTCVRAALDVTQGIFDLTGARSTSNRYRFDRFWRNARTFSTHDPTDAKDVWIGDWHLTGKEPPLVAMLRV